MRFRYIHAISIIILLLNVSPAESYDNKITHRLMTESAVGHSFIVSQERYLIDILGREYIAKKQFVVKEKLVSAWFEDGADFEDELPKDSNPCRAANHFHNPIKGWQDGTILPWDQAQMTDGSASFIGDKVNDVCEKGGWKFSERKSSVTWGTTFLEPVAEGALKAEMPRQQWSWDDARLHFYRALTETDKEIRDQELADTFRGVGHVVHLIQDSAQPAHVRNDFQSHLYFTHLDFVEFKKSFGSLYEYYVQKRKNLVLEAQAVMPEINNPSLTDFWDTNTYDGSVQLNGLNLGLTELTNANYFSDETIPNNVLAWKGIGFEEQAREHLFPFPKLSDEDYEVCLQDVLMDAGDATEIYIARKSRGGCAASGDKFASRYADSSFINSPGMRDISKMELTLDDKVYGTYARELLPLAIGYSSALINYFFRGRLGVIAMPDGVMIKNLSEDAMAAYVDDQGNSVGKIEIYYDRIDGSRHLLASHTLDSVLDKGAVSPLIPFSHPADNVTPMRYIAVFRGKLGKEEGAVIGRVVSPKIYYVSEQEQGGEYVKKIMRMTPNGENKTVIFDNRNPNFGIGKFSVSADGSRIVFTGWENDGPGYLYSLDISEPDTLPVELAPGTWPDLSPSGNKLLFQRGEQDPYSRQGSQIFIYDLDTKSEQLLAMGNAERSDAFPTWGPDGQSIVYLTNALAELPPAIPAPGEAGCGNSEESLEIMGSNGVHLRSATECLNKFHFPTNSPKVSAISQPAWSLDGKDIFYTTKFWFLLDGEFTSEGWQKYRKDRGQPFKVNITTQEETALFKPEEENDVQFTGISSWSMDGRQIAVTRYPYSASQILYLSRSDIVLVDSNTGEERLNLTEDNARGDFYPDFAY